MRGEKSLQSIHRKKNKKDSPGFKIDINSLISPATDTSWWQDGSVTQNSSSFFPAIQCEEGVCQGQGIPGRLLCWMCPDTALLNSQLLVSLDEHTAGGSNPGRVPTWGKNHLDGSFCSHGHHITQGPAACLRFYCEGRGKPKRGIKPHGAFGRSVCTHFYQGSTCYSFSIENWNSSYQAALSTAPGIAGELVNWPNLLNV